MRLFNALVTTDNTFIGIAVYDLFASAAILLGLLGVILTIWALVEVLKSTFKDPNGKVIWVLIVLFLNLFGALLWFFWGRKTQRA